MATKVLGVDPGKKGGLVILALDDVDGRLVVWPVNHYKMPIVKKTGRIDVNRIQEIIIENEVFFGAVERQFVFGKQGSGLTIGMNYGYILATLELCGVKFIEVHPKTWQEVIYESLGSRATEKCKDALTRLVEYQRKETKAASIEFCEMNSFPVPLTSSNANARPFDGIADAWGIAYWYALNYHMEGSHDGVVNAK